MKKLLFVVILMVLGAAGFTLWQYSQETGREPWKWTSADWGDWITFTKHETRQMGMEAKESGQATWRWVGENTPALFEKSKELMARLGYQDTKEPAGQPPSGAIALAPVGPTQTGSADQPTDPLDIESTDYKYGKEWLAKGIAEWKVSLVHPGAAERAKEDFQKAISSFAAAKAEIGESAGVTQLEQAARDYLADTDERLELIRQGGE